ncbi:uncharacterized protein [Amphiura filiformis]|uniref:uncharacterized protein n=1 Tax=Amphiura filiformis TaxID=82378 RepID=UPI003B20FF7B
MVELRHSWFSMFFCFCFLFTGCGNGGAGKARQRYEIMRRGLQERVIHAYTVVRQHLEADKKKYTDPECATYDHPVYGCTGRCMLSSECPGGKATIVEGLCDSQPYDIRCCFSAITTRPCASFDHFIHGKTGHCTKKSKCPHSNYMSDLCPGLAPDVECCFSKPIDNCPLLIADESSRVPDDCLRCIRDVTYNHTTGTDTCEHLENGEYICAPFHLNDKYWLEAATSCTEINTDWHFCIQDYECSKATVQAYMKLHATTKSLGHRPTCEDFARIHKGGPNGYKYYSTWPFWSRVRECLDKT